MEHSRPRLCSGKAGGTRYSRSSIHFRRVRVVHTTVTTNPGLHTTDHWTEPTLRLVSTAMKRILLTGMSGTGKSTLIAELAARGHKAVDLDQPAWSEMRTVAGASGEVIEEDWVWREDRVRDLLSTENAGVLFVSGCATNQVMSLVGKCMTVRPTTDDRRPTTDDKKL